MEKIRKKCWKKLEKIEKSRKKIQLFFSPHHPDQMSEGSQVSKVTLCVKILKWQSPTKTTPRSSIELPGQLKIVPIIFVPSGVPRRGSNNFCHGEGVSWQFRPHLPLKHCSRVGPYLRTWISIGS